MLSWLWTQRSYWKQIDWAQERKNLDDTLTLLRTISHIIATVPDPADQIFELQAASEWYKEHRPGVDEYPHELIAERIVLLHEKLDIAQELKNVKS
jgi:hypothetical protein